MDSNILKFNNLLLKTIVKEVKEVKEDVQSMHRNLGIDVQVKYKDIKNEYIKLLRMCKKFSNDYINIIDIEYIFNTYADIHILYNDTDNTEIIYMPDINSEHQIAKNFKNFIDSRKKQYLMDIDWSKHYIYKNLNKIEENPTTFLNGTMEIARISDWMYRNKTKVAYQIINQNFNDAYDLLNGMLKSEYINIIGFLRFWNDMNQKDRN